MIECANFLPFWSPIFEKKEHNLNIYSYDYGSKSLKPQLLASEGLFLKLKFLICLNSDFLRKPYIAVQTERKARELEKYFKIGSGKAVLYKRIL